MICGLYFAMPLTFKYLYEMMTSTWWQSGTIYFFVKGDNCRDTIYLAPQ